MIEMTASEMATLEAEAARGKRKAVPQSIPSRVVENVTLQNVNTHTIKRNLRGLRTHDGPITGIEWLLIHFDSTAAIYAAACPYEFCEGTGTLEAMGIIDSRGKLELPFAAPGALCCPKCDDAISKLYETEAAKMAKPRRVISAKPKMLDHSAAS